MMKRIICVMTLAEAGMLVGAVGASELTWSDPAGDINWPNAGKVDTRGVDGVRMESIDVLK